ncbi:efflux RND transporter periplasmic adaptor subunit [Lacibacter sp. H375]|uniref:efflux RND transporter periplasmic adaptor subunit n=1 Tax=Lacibacter sp. H375 TaxID=3133424 RepID=UPI0030BFC017
MQVNFLKSISMVLFIAISAIACSSKASGDKQTNKTAAIVPALPVDVKIVAAANIDQSEVVAGSIVANRVVDITGELPKKISMVLFKDGSFVEAGQALYKLQDSDIKARIRQLDAEMNLAVINEKRLSELLRTESVRREEYDVALARLQSLQAQKELLEVELSKTVIKAPFSGLIGISKVFTGSFVTPGVPLVSLVEQQVMKIQFSVSEKYISVVKPGSKIYFTTELNSQMATAVVVSTEASLDAQSRNIIVQAQFSNAGNKYKPGMSARVSFSTSGKNEKSIMLPTEALIPGGNGYSVFVVRNGVAKLIPVVIGNRNESEAVIKSGLQPGDSVMISNTLRAADGTPVAVVSHK